MTILNDNNVDEIMASDKAYLILFYADTIPTIESVKQIFEDFDTQLKGKVEVLKCDIESQPRVKEYMQMNTLPAILFIKGGSVYGNLAGPASKAKYESIVKEGLMRMIEDSKPKENSNVLSAEEMYGE